MKAQFSYVHWGRVLLTSVLVDILIIILGLVLSSLVFLVWGQPDLLHSDQVHTAYQVASWSAAILDILLTVGGAIWIAHKVERAAPLHGFLMGLVAALILFLPSLVSNRQLDLPALALLALMVAAGWLGGVLGSRGREQS